MTTINNEATIVYEEKFKSAGLYTSNLISSLIEKYGLQNTEATKIAISSFLAYGKNKFKVKEGKFDIEILTQLLKYGVLYPYQDEPNTYRQWLPNDMLEFRTIKSDDSNIRVETKYRTTYLDGTYTEIPEDQIKEKYMVNRYV